MPDFCGNTQQKLYSSPSLQSSLQKLSLISLFDWKILAPSGASENAWIKRSRTCPIWSIALPGDVFSLFHSLKEPVYVELVLMKITSLLLILMILTCGGVAAIGETFIFVGKSPLNFL